jgi:hypothetical protein
MKRKSGHGSPWVQAICCTAGALVGILGGLTFVVLVLFPAEVPRSWGGDENGLSLTFAVESLLSVILGGSAGISLGWGAAVLLRQEVEQPSDESIS